ncbi:glutathione-disulfide reductase [Endozoicomonas sp. SM1973]|uniref:Glutathione reductase n=1 Tax=Spartinivicinus marinus TaxID=2994442 RepID=A0A853ICN4_9GAMM|nr:glutathione-disulfide reductase [Spartinivicinus marinus]MCX4025659.1 glutathione-disulfide reductase [Spartinivicinus marinus]NYZ68318.1 glutathione-disulfide reductase [Spartinivicinus marinus]
MTSSKYDYDLFVIGAGSGGVRASRMAASFGAKVAIAEDRYMGGTCVNVGCVPKKLYVYGSHFGEDIADGAGYGWQASDVSFDWTTLRDNKKQEISRLNGVYRNLLKNAGVKLIEGRAALVDAHTVKVGKKKYSAERILIATGGWPYIPEFPGSEHAITSNEVFDLDKFPQRIIVVGGGYIAVEFAGIFAGLGAETHLVYRRDLFLRGFDQDIREFVRDEVAKKHVNLHFNTEIDKIEKLATDALVAHTNKGEQIAADVILYATGRKPNLHGLGLENVKVKLNGDGTIKVDDYFNSSEPSIYAVGDVIGGPELTPVALAEGMALAKTLYLNEPNKVDYDNIPTAVFSQPNIATVGLTEEQARERGYELEIYKASFRHLKHTLSGRDERTMMKLVVEKESQKVLGCHMVGADAGEIIQGMAVAIKAGATKAVFDSTIGIHPTAAEEFVTMREPVSN